jgi:hypothetical protein
MLIWQIVYYSLRCLVKLFMDRDMTQRMKIVKIKNDGDRLLLYGDESFDRWGYHIIAGMTDDIRVGDIVEYEPYGSNFGKFIKVIVDG